jgi:hypothetical protein
MTSRAPQILRIAVDRTWDGAPVDAGERAELELALGDPWQIRVQAPYHADPAPPEPRGSRDRLWELEVVELFLLGAGERYLEVELGPHGHYLVLELDGVRRVQRQGIPIEYRASIDGARWTGQARLPAALLPGGLRAWNAYAIHGEGGARRYLAAHAVGGAAPDFHRLDCFAPLPRG